MGTAHERPGQVGMPIDSDDAGAVEVAARLIRDIGFEPVLVVIDSLRKRLDYTNRMKRTAILIVLLAAMLWQSVDLVRAGVSADRLSDLQHALLHWQDEAHHHHDDGGFHLDDSEDSVRHVVADNVNASALLPHVSPQIPDIGPDELRVREPRAGPCPYLDGLMRPPRLTA